MELEGALTVAGTPQQVWDRLIDVGVLQRCIPGCTELDQTSDRDFAGKMAIKVGPVSATFAGTVALDEMVEPESCVLSGQGKGGAAGFAKGSARITLAPVSEGTEIRYVATVQIGGKLAAVGNRLFGTVAKRNIDDFFTSFSNEMQAAMAA